MRDEIHYPRRVRHIRRVFSDNCEAQMREITITLTEKEYIELEEYAEDFNSTFENKFSIADVVHAEIITRLIEWRRIADLQK